MVKQSLPTVLAIETATAACSVALLTEEQVYKRHEVLPQKHAHRVLEMVDEVVAESGLTSSAIDLIAFGEGPGAFTGIRIATGVVQGLALGWDKPVAAISSLKALALTQLRMNPQLNGKTWCCLLDARMNEVYQLSGVYENDGCVVDGDVQLISPDAVTALIESQAFDIGIGDITSEYPEIVARLPQWIDALPDAVSVAKLAQLNPEIAQALEQQIPAPLYLRNHVADTIEERKLKAKNQ